MQDEVHQSVAAVSWLPKWTGRTAWGGAVPPPIRRNGAAPALPNPGKISNCGAAEFFHHTRFGSPQRWRKSPRYAPCASTGRPAELCTMSKYSPTKLIERHSKNSHASPGLVIDG